MRADGRARRYLLGTLDEEERDALEKEYFGGEHELERVSAAEDELVEDYLDNRLPREERERFEREYLASRAHRVRVETIRRLIGRAQSESRGSRVARSGAQAHWLGLAAAAVLIAAAGLWILNQRTPQVRQAPSASAASRPPRQPSTSAPASSAPASVAPSPSILALELSPLAVRSAGEAARVIIPAGTQLVDLRLLEPAGRPAMASTVSIATPEGEEAWRGSASVNEQVIHVQVPASILRPNDYIVTLHAGRAETRYFLRVRGR